MLKIDDQEYERVEEFKFLVTVLTEHNDITAEIKQQIIMANKTSYGLQKHLHSSNLKRPTKRMLHRTLITPLLTYGS
jgi:hypothetical protein